MVEDAVGTDGSFIDRKARLRIPPHYVAKQTPFERIKNWDEVYFGYTPAPAMFEAQRCIQCPAAPCIKACPIDNDIPGAFAELESGRLIEAAEIFRRTSEMPELCGRLCPQESLCEGSCVVGKKSKPVAIGRLEAFLGDYHRTLKAGFHVPIPEFETNATLAVVGSGPAGLAVAERMRSLGHDITIFEAWPKGGGVIRYGIPNFKSAKNILDEKLAALEKAGIKFKFCVRVGVDISWDVLDKFDAVFLSHGAGLCKSLKMQGEEANGVYTATEFLVQANLPPSDLPTEMNSRIDIGKNVVVVGGGDTSMDCVRSALRLGASKVTLLYRRTEHEMIGREEERRHAREEGVNFEYLTTPVAIIQDDHVIRGVECVRMELGELDESGRRTPTQIQGSEFIIDADSLIVAVGYDVDKEFLGPDSHVALDDYGRVIVDGNGCTSRPGVFAAGDNVNGADLVVTALASAHCAFPSIEKCLADVAVAIKE